MATVTSLIRGTNHAPWEMNMAWKKVVSYSFGFRQTDRKFWLYYTLEGSSAAVQLDLTATQFTALAQAFNAASGVNFETTGKYFATAARAL